MNVQIFKSVVLDDKEKKPHNLLDEFHILHSCLTTCKVIDLISLRCTRTSNTGILPCCFVPRTEARYSNDKQGLNHSFG